MLRGNNKEIFWLGALLESDSSDKKQRIQLLSNSGTHLELILINNRSRRFLWKTV